MLVQLKEPFATKYRTYLRAYRQRTGKAPTFRERTAAYFCVQDGTIPWWMHSSATFPIYPSAVDYSKLQDD